MAVGSHESYQASSCVIPAFERGFLTGENLSSMLESKTTIPEWLTVEIMQRMRSVAMEQELRI